MAHLAGDVPRGPLAPWPPGRPVARHTPLLVRQRPLELHEDVRALESQLHLLLRGRLPEHPLDLLGVQLAVLGLLLVEAMQVHRVLGVEPVEGVVGALLELRGRGLHEVVWVEGAEHDEAQDPEDRGQGRDKSVLKEPLFKVRSHLESGENQGGKGGMWDTL